MVPFRVRFWKHVLVCSHGKSCSWCCWPWDSYEKRPDDYGYFYVNVQYPSQRAHIVSWRIHNGLQKIPDNLVVMHACDYKPCVSPHHLSLGTQSQNIISARENGLGEKGKLTEALVRQIRTKFAYGSRTQESLAEEYGVSRVLIGHILRRVSWKDVQDDLQPFIDEKRGRDDKLTAEDVVAIRHLYATEAKNQSELAIYYGVSQRHIGAIVRGQICRSAGGEIVEETFKITGTKNNKSKLDADKVREIRQLSASGMAQRPLARKFGVSQRAIVQVIQRLTWAHVL